MKKILCFFIALSLVSIFAAFTSADKGKRLKWWQKWLTIEANYHHIGDQTLPWLIPEPEGTYWESNFYCSEFTLRRTNIALVKFLGMDINGADLIVNGEPIELEPSTNAEFFEIYVVGVPLEVLQTGKNKISIEAHQWSNGTFDDFQFGELQMKFQ